jgi:hypothetical protein
VIAIALAAVLTSCTESPPPARTPSPTIAGRVPCGPAERFERHAHAHLTIVVRGQLRPPPSNVGITPASICWLHTHDTSGIIHVEAGDDRPFTLGDFFAVWGPPLSGTVLAGERVGGGETIQVFENQRPYTGAPETIVLDDKDDIVLQLGPPFPTVAPYVWPPGY